MSSDKEPVIMNVTIAPVPSPQEFVTTNFLQLAEFRLKTTKFQTTEDVDAMVFRITVEMKYATEGAFQFRSYLPQNPSIPDQIPLKIGKKNRIWIRSHQQALKNHLYRLQSRI